MQSGHHCTMITKTTHTRSPKKWLDKTMKDFPGGTWIVLEGTTEVSIVTWYGLDINIIKNTC